MGVRRQLERVKKVDLQAIISDMYKHGLRRWLLLALTDAYEEARQGKKRTADEHAFEVNEYQNLINLRDAILERRYKNGDSIVFVIFDPMVREIFAAPFRARVVHHFLNWMTAGWWDQHFIPDSFSCRVGKGTDSGRARAQKMMRRVSQGGRRKAWSLKMDISGYFMSLPREKLYERILWGLEQQFKDVIDDPMGRQLFSICAYLWHEVIMDDPTVNARRRGAIWHWDPKVLPMNKSLYTQPDGYGLPIGNVTSQLASNIYLDLFDRYVVYELGYKNYVRYVDDFVIFVPDEEKVRLLADVEKMEKFLLEEMELTLHKKKRSCQEVRKGVNFVGGRIYLNCIMPSNRLQAKFPEALKALIVGEGSLDTVVSYVGLMRHMDANNYILSVLNRLGE